MTAGQNQFAPEFNAKEVIELLESATPENTKKSHKVWHENSSR